MFGPYATVQPRVAPAVSSEIVAAPHPPWGSPPASYDQVTVIALLYQPSLHPPPLQLGVGKPSALATAGRSAAPTTTTATETSRAALMRAGPCLAPRRPARGCRRPRRRRAAQRRRAAEGSCHHRAEDRRARRPGGRVGPRRAARAATAHAVDA